MMHIPIYRFVQRARNHSASEKRSSSRHIMIKSVIYYRNLQQRTTDSITKIHHILQFAQFPWLRKYIKLNTNFRTLAKNEFEKNLFKLMSNAIFDKTMENVRSHVDV